MNVRHGLFGCNSRDSMRHYIGNPMEGQNRLLQEELRHQYSGKNRKPAHANHVKITALPHKIGDKRQNRYDKGKKTFGQERQAARNAGKQ